MTSVRVLLVCAAALCLACDGGTKCKDYDLNGGGTTGFLGHYTCTQSSQGTEVCAGYYGCTGTASLDIVADGAQSKIYASSCYWGYSEYSGGVCEPDQNNSGKGYFTFYGTANADSGSRKIRSTINGSVTAGEPKPTAVATLVLSVTPEIGAPCSMTTHLSCEYSY